MREVPGSIPGTALFIFVMPINDVHLNSATMSDIKFAFGLLDVENTGLISLADLRVVLQALHYDFNREEVKSLYDQGRSSMCSKLKVRKDAKASDVQRIEDGKLNFELLVEIIRILIQRPESRENLTEAFNLLKGETGGITATDLAKVSSLVAEDTSPDELNEMISSSLSMSTSRKASPDDAPASVGLADFLRVFENHSQGPKLDQAHRQHP